MTFQVSIVRKSDGERFTAVLTDRKLSCDGLSQDVVAVVEDHLSRLARPNGTVRVADIKYDFRILKPRKRE